MSDSGSKQISIPTDEQCRDHAKVYEDENRIGYAIWYPQMGGYIARAVALIHRDQKEQTGFNPCIDVLVWHDGEFPFSDGESPRELHHCSSMQFIQFGETLAELNKANDGDHESKPQEQIYFDTWEELAATVPAGVSFVMIRCERIRYENGCGIPDGIYYRRETAAD